MLNQLLSQEKKAGLDRVAAAFAPLKSHSDAAAATTAPNEQGAYTRTLCVNEASAECPPQL